MTTGSFSHIAVPPRRTPLDLNSVAFMAGSTGTMPVGWRVFRLFFALLVGKGSNCDVARRSRFHHHQSGIQEDRRASQNPIPKLTVGSVFTSVLDPLSAPPDLHPFSPSTRILVGRIVELVGRTLVREKLATGRSVTAITRDTARAMVEILLRPPNAENYQSQYISL